MTKSSWVCVHICVWCANRSKKRRFVSSLTILMKHFEAKLASSSLSLKYTQKRQIANALFKFVFNRKYPKYALNIDKWIWYKNYLCLFIARNFKIRCLVSVYLHQDFSPKQLLVFISKYIFDPILLMPKIPLNW